MLKKVVITIPIHKSNIEDLEKDSLKQCLTILAKYDIAIVAPYGLDLSEYENIFKQYNKTYIVQNFDNTFFNSYIGYNKLCLSPCLYERFSEYEYMLIYHLDAWVFKDELQKWCDYGYDYIGAPLNPDVIKNLNLNVVNSGNGGFCLRKISSMLKLLSYGLDNKKLNNYKTLQNIYSLKRKKHLLSNIINIPYFLYCWVFQYFLNWRFMYNEDLIIAYYATKYYPDFKIADNKMAAKFALEYNAKEMYYSPDYELPFGAHNPVFYIFLIYKEAIRKELTKWQKF